MNYLSTLFTRESQDDGARFGYAAGVALTTSGDLLILDSENLRILRFSADSRLLLSFGGFDAGPGRLRSPLKITTGADDRIFVAEPSRILEYDHAGNFVGEFGSAVFTNLKGCSVSGEKLVAVTSDTLYVFSTSGKLEFLIRLESIIITDGSLDFAQDVAFDGKKILLLDGRKIHVLSFSGND